MPIMPSLQRRRLQCYLALIIGDIFSIFAGLALAGHVYAAASGMQDSLKLAQLLLPVFLTVALYNDAYSIDSLERAGASVSRALSALVISTAVVMFVTFYTKSALEYSRAGVSLGLLVVAFVLSWVRLQMRAVVRWRCGATVQNELVIDDGGPRVSLPGAYHVSAEKFGLRPLLSDPYALDRIGLIMRNADRVIVSSSSERKADWGVILKGANVAGEVVDESVVALSALGARLVGGQGLLQVSVGPLDIRSRIAKRLLDLFVAGSVLLALSPMLLAVAVAIKLEDRGPVFFVQRRVGRSNRFFKIYKFRSMSVNRIGRDGGQSASKGDARITRVGRLIRASSVDELPQLFNVLKGDMSLVGPRPHAIASQAGDKLFWEVDRRYWERHALKPGLTGLAQVKGWRGATDHESDLVGRLNADLEYLADWSLARDIWILISTFRVLVHDRAF